MHPAVRLEPQQIKVNLSVQDVDEVCSKQLSEIIGTCLIDGRPSEFLADIGTSRTIINERLVPITDRQQIRASGVELVTANGSLASVVGIKHCKFQLDGRMYDTTNF